MGGLTQSLLKKGTGSASFKRSAFRKVCVIGDSITQQAFVSSAGVSQVFENVGYATWLRQLSQQQIILDFDGEFAENGHTTTGIVTDYLEAAAAYSADFAIVHIGTNDTTGTSIPFATTVNNLTTIYRKLIRSGKTVIAVPPLPRTHPDTAQRNEHERIVRWIINYARTTRGIILANPTKYMIDAASADGNARSGYTFDGLHPSPLGSYYMAKAIWEAMQPFIPFSDIRFMSAGSVYDATNNPSGNLLLNGLLAGTAGTEGTSATGDTATSWTLSPDSATGINTFAAVGSKVNRTDGESGVWQQIAVSGTPTSARTFSLNQTVSASGLYVAGDVLELVAEYEIDTGHSGLRSVEASLRDRNSASSTIYTAIDGDEFSTVDFFVADPGTIIRGVLRTPLVTVNNDPGNFVVNLNITAQANTACTATVRFGRVSVRKVS